MTLVLVVEDDPVVGDVVRRYLEQDGLLVQVRSDGPTALAAARQAPPDLVVLDLGLPGMDGLEVFRRLQQPAQVPVIILTARGEEDDRLLGLGVGADDYVTKPFSPRELVLRVRAVLRAAPHHHRALRWRRHRAGCWSTATCTSTSWHTRCAPLPARGR